MRLARQTEQQTAERVAAIKEHPKFKMYLNFLEEVEQVPADHVFGADDTQADIQHWLWWLGEQEHSAGVSRKKIAEIKKHAMFGEYLKHLVEEGVPAEHEFGSDDAQADIEDWLDWLQTKDRHAEDQECGEEEAKEHDDEIDEIDGEPEQSFMRKHAKALL